MLTIELCVLLCIVVSFKTLNKLLTFKFQISISAILPQLLKLYLFYFKYKYIFFCTVRLNGSYSYLFVRVKRKLRDDIITDVSNRGLIGPLYYSTYKPLALGVASAPLLTLRNIARDSQGLQDRVERPSTHFLIKGNLTLNVFDEQS